MIFQNAPQTQSVGFLVALQVTSKKGNIKEGHQRERKDPQNDEASF